MALLVGFHLAMDPPAPPKASIAPAALFVAELEALVATGDTDFAAAPLDPDLFDAGTRRR